MKKESISDRDLKALLFLVMLLVAGLTYFIGFQVLLKSTSVTKSENVELKAELTDLQEKDRNKEDTLKKTEEYKNKIDTIVNQYPSKVTEQKLFYDIAMLSKGLGKTHFPSLTGEMNSLFYPSAEDGTSDSTSNTESSTDNQEENGDGQEEKPGFTSDGVVMVYKTEAKTQVKGLSYTSLKRLVKTVNEYDGRMTIDSMNLKFSKDDGLLEGEIVFDYYALEGSPKRYKNPNITGVAAGVKNIFGTFDAK